MSESLEVINPLTLEISSLKAPVAVFKTPVATFKLFKTTLLDISSVFARGVEDTTEIESSPEIVTDMLMLSYCQ